MSDTTFAFTANDLLNNQRSMNGAWLWTGCHWVENEKYALKLLVDIKAPLEKSASALGRSPSSIAHRARDTGLKLPKEWASFIWPRKPRIARNPVIRLAYPYITVPRDEHADLLAVNALVPHGYTEVMRADICQEIMLALWQRTVTLEELKARGIRKFVSKVRHDNFERGGYGVVSLDQPMQDGRSWHDVLEYRGASYSNEGEGCASNIGTRASVGKPRSRLDRPERRPLKSVWDGTM